MPNCPRCGAALPAPSSFCPYCGAPQSVAPPPVAPYAVLPPYAQPRKDNTALIVVLVVVAVVLVVALPALLYVMVSGLLTAPGPGTGMKPFITFSSPTNSNGIETVSVASASQNAAPTNFKVNLGVNGTVAFNPASLTTAGGAITLSVGIETFTIVWYDPSGVNAVVGGTYFTISGATTTAPLPASTTFILYLFWSDGSQIQTAGWST